MENKAEYRNRTKGVIGVVTLTDEHKPHGTPVRPGETVWLSEKERVLTANAPRDSANNPFVGGAVDGAALELVSEERPTGGTTRPTEPVSGSPEPEAEKGDQTPPEDVEATEKAKQEEDARRLEEEKGALERQQAGETGAAEPPTGEAAEGSFGRGEEVGDPAAPAAVGDGHTD